MKRREEAWGKISQLAHNNPLVRALFSCHANDPRTGFI